MQLSVCKATVMQHLYMVRLSASVGLPLVFIRRLFCSQLPIYLKYLQQTLLLQLGSSLSDQLFTSSCFTQLLSDVLAQWSTLYDAVLCIVLVPCIVLGKRPFSVVIVLLSYQATVHYTVYTHTFVEMVTCHSHAQWVNCMTNENIGCLNLDCMSPVE